MFQLTTQPMLLLMPPVMNVPELPSDQQPEKKVLLIPIYRVVNNKITIYDYARHYTEEIMLLIDILDAESDIEQRKKILFEIEYLQERKRKILLLEVYL